MSEPYQIFVLLPAGISGKEAVYGTHEVLEEMNGSLEEDCSLYLNDTKDEEPEPEFISTLPEALHKLATWPTLGSIDYAMPEGLITVSYKCPPDSNIVEAIKLSVPEGAYEKGHEESKRRYSELARRLHTRFGANRTIMEWGLEYKDFCWLEEIGRLKRGQIVGKYDLVDLRADGS
jgi:hypothetical protein